MENENKENRDKANTGEHITKVFAVITNNNALKKHQSKRPDYLKVVLLILYPACNRRVLPPERGYGHTV